MNKIKTRKNWEALQSVEETIDLSGRMKRGLLSKAKKQTGKHSQEQATASEYSQETLENLEDEAAHDAGHIIAGTGKIIYQSGKKLFQASTSNDINGGSVTEVQLLESNSSISPSNITPAFCKTSNPLTPIEGKHNPAIHTPPRTEFPSTVRDRSNAVKHESKQAPVGMIQPRQTISRGNVVSPMVAVKNAAANPRAVPSPSAQIAGQSMESAKETFKRSTHIKQVVAQKAQAMAKASAKAIRETAKATAASGRMAVASVSAGAGILVFIVILVVMIGALSGSPYGIFLSDGSANDNTSIQEAVEVLSDEYVKKLNRVRLSADYDKMEVTGENPVWQEVVAIYAVQMATDPDSAQEVVTVDEIKMSELRNIFWDMYKIESTVEITAGPTATTEETAETTDSTMAETVLKVTISKKSPEELAKEYRFTEKQIEKMNELLQLDESLWWGTLFGVHSPDLKILATAANEIGNLYGEKYWDWYGFEERVDWCACFVSWCGAKCRYIQAGTYPQFSACGKGMNWFKERNLWEERDYVPEPGNIIFFSWDNENGLDGSIDHVGIVEKVEDGYVHTIEGNAYDMVMRRKYKLGWYEILGYGKPMYE